MTTAASPSLNPGIPPAKNMQGFPTPLSVLGPQADAERQRIRQQFETGTSAREAVSALCELADRNVQQIFGEVLRVHNREAQGLCLLALGGYGRRMLLKRESRAGIAGADLRIFADIVGHRIPRQLGGAHAGGV